MASLIENLITELNEEYAVYEELLGVSMEKTGIIVKNDLDKLKAVTDREQLLVDTVTGLENTRRGIMANIASVLNKRAEDIKISDVVSFLEGQPEFHDPLADINDRLNRLAKKLKEVNTHNQNLIMDSLSMIEYNINLLQNLSRSPETAEYSRDMFKGAGGYSMEGMPGKFDAKQ